MLKNEILKILRESDSHISGQELCERFGVSRTAIWKAINSLRDEGYEIEAVSNRGYVLKSLADTLRSEEIEGFLETKWLGRHILSFDTIDSTNNELRRRFENTPDIADGTLAITGNQTNGRGRRGRSWNAPAESNIAMSFLLKPDFPPEKASMMTILAALSVAAAIEEVTDLSGQIKWPNDVLVNKKKCCGILTEMSCERDYINYAIVGIGINANTDSFPPEYGEHSSSLFLETGERVKRAQLAAAVLKAFEGYYGSFVKVQSLEPFMEEYNGKLLGIGNIVKVLDPKGEFTGTSRGINSQGELLVEKEDGSLTEIYAGEVSVRGIYGYV